MPSARISSRKPGRRIEMSSRHAQLSMVVIVGYSLFQLRSPGPAGNRFRRFPFGSCIGRFDEFSDQNHLVDGVTPSLKANARRELYRMRRLHYEFFRSYFLFSFPKLARQVCQMLSSLRSAGRRHRKKRTCRRNRAIRTTFPIGRTSTAASLPAWARGVTVPRV